MNWCMTTIYWYWSQPHNFIIIFFLATSPVMHRPTGKFPGNPKSHSAPGSSSFFFYLEKHWSNSTGFWSNSFYFCSSSFIYLIICLSAVGKLTFSSKFIFFWPSKLRFLNHFYFFFILSFLTVSLFIVFKFAKYPLVSWKVPTIQMH